MNVFLKPTTKTTPASLNRLTTDYNDVLAYVDAIHQDLNWVSWYRPDELRCWDLDDPDEDDSDEEGFDPYELLEEEDDDPDWRDRLPQPQPDIRPTFEHVRDIDIDDY